VEQPWQPTVGFRPHLLLRGGHAQTLFAALSEAAPLPCRPRQHILPVPEGDQIVVHDDCPAGWKNGDVCALLIHGLGGCHASPYMVRICHKLYQRGVRVLRMDMRGFGAGMGLARKPGHAGRSEDADAAAQFAHALCPDSPLALIGFSLGANLLLKMLGEWGTSPLAVPVRALAVAPPIDLQACSDNIQRWQRLLYNRFFVRALLRQTRERKTHDSQLAALSLEPPPRTLFQFDDRVTAPLSGFAGAAEYYARSSAAALLQHIRLPTTLLVSADDPVVPAAMFSQVADSDYVRLHTTRRGGHVGYIGRSGVDADRYWLDWRVVEFVTQAAVS
jgi:uncharacterized protein